MSVAALPSLIDTVRAAAARATPLRICGGGTKDFLARGLDGEPLPTTGLTGIVAYKIVDLTIGLRVSEEDEREGLDITSHGETAYSR